MTVETIFDPVIGFLVVAAVSGLGAFAFVVLFVVEVCRGRGATFLKAMWPDRHERREIYRRHRRQAKAEIQAAELVRRSRQRAARTRRPE